MNILIHACPARMWYVDGFLVPELRRQGAEHIEIWNDTAGKGNLRACMESFAARMGDGGTWHLRKETIERVFADAKEKHGMRYTHHRGLARVTNWVRLKFAAMNLKKLAVWAWKRFVFSYFFALFMPEYVNSPVFA